MGRFATAAWRRLRGAGEEDGETAPSLMRPVVVFQDQDCR